MIEGQEETNVAVMDEPEAAASAPKKAKKKAAKKGKGKAKGKAKAKTSKESGAPRSRKVYSLTAGTKVDEYNPKTHPGAVVHALKKLGEGTSQEIIAEIKKQGKIETDMNLNDAVGYQLWNLSIGKQKGILKTKAAPKKAA